jgi:hypothetical protein
MPIKNIKTLLSNLLNAFKVRSINIKNVAIIKLFVRLLLSKKSVCIVRENEQLLMRIYNK